ncbi:MAG TPA: hypothetical protein VFJ90_13425, partial [Candidatus Didemnitutus sp.]|nr:hypothetical protein [Candidatus Didemnitutus sp.]
MKIRLVLSLIGFAALVASVGCHSAAPVTQTPALKTRGAALATSAPLVWQNSPGQPTYYINSVAICGDGSRVVGGTFFHSYGSSADTAAAGVAASAPEAKSGDGQTGTFGMYAYDRTGKQLWKDEFNGWQGVYWVDISASGAFAASGGWFSQNPYAGFVRAFNATTGQRLLDYRTKNRVNQVVLSADGTWLISAAESLCLFHLVSGAYQKTAEFPAPTSSSGSNYFVSAGFSADGSTVVCSDYAGHILLLGATGGNLTLAQQWTLPNSSSSHMVRLTPDGHTFVAGGPSGSFYLFDTAQFVTSGQPTITYSTGVSGSVYSVAVSDDGSAFVGVVNYQ